MDGGSPRRRTVHASEDWYLLGRRPHRQDHGFNRKLRMNQLTPAICTSCGEEFDFRRLTAGYKICLECGEQKAINARKSWCIAPMHKSNYQLITNRQELIGLNNKGGLVK